MTWVTKITDMNRLGVVTYVEQHKKAFSIFFVHVNATLVDATREAVVPFTGRELY